MKIKAIKCFNCGDIVFSRANHDFRECSCGGVFVDGGHYNSDGVLYFSRCGGNAIKKDSEFKTIEIKTTCEEELYDDWNNGFDNFGIFHSQPVTFLGGTCAESTWREELIKDLTIKYFNPVVEDWTPECQEEEIRMRKECGICLYVLTKSMKGGI